MKSNDKPHTIYIRSTGERIPVTKEECDAYYRDINTYRIRQQRHGRCVCPESKRLSCDMDCYTCPFSRAGDTRSLDYVDTDEEGNETSWLEQMPDETPLIEDIIADASEIESLFKRLAELMPEAVEIGRQRLEGKPCRSESKKTEVCKKSASLCFDHLCISAMSVSSMFITFLCSAGGSVPSFRDNSDA